MLAKVIASGESREAARKRASAALRSFPILGVRTNMAFLINVLEHRAFASGNVHTAFVDDHMNDLLETRDADDIVTAVAAFARGAQSGVDAYAIGPGHDPWSTLTRWGR
jgi:acetyl/propionyl-CoA carboxylase alpha subunit